MFLRRTISLLVLILIPLGFFGICNPAFLFLSKLQFGQFFLDISVKTAVLCFSILLITFVFGRIYCSLLCPLGTFQDIAGALSTSLTGKKYSFHRDYKFFRYLLFIFVIALFILGLPALIVILDPYSIYVRGASGLLDQAAGAVIGIMEPVLRNLNIYYYYSSGSIGFSSVLLLIMVFFAAFFRGRFFCNTVCPIGMILGCISQASVLHPTFNENCISCGKCEAICKAECISVSDKLIDRSRCVMCGNCAKVCCVAAMDFSKRIIQQDNEKRKTIKSIASMALFIVLPLIKTKKFLMNTHAFSGLAGKIAKSDLYPQIPPGAMSWARFLDKCIGCHACIKRCPSKVLDYAGLRFGLNGALKPMLNFSKGFCQYDCVVCGETCPFGAITPIDTGEKHKIQAGIASYNRGLCVITTSGERCGACAEHCPTGALEMVPDENNHVPIPAIIQKLCVGCGACEYICPVIPQKAIIVNPLPVHQTAEILKTQNNSTVEERDDDFKF